MEELTSEQKEDLKKKLQGRLFMEGDTRYSIREQVQRTKWNDSIIAIAEQHGIELDLSNVARILEG